jgi:tight adherence protein B
VNPMVALYLIMVLTIFALIQAVAAYVAERRAWQARPAEEGLRRRTMADGLAPWLADTLVKRSVGAFERLVTTSGVSSSPQNVLVLIALLVGAAALATALLRLPAVPTAAAILAAAVLPLLFLKMARRRRLVRLVEQLPDALGMLVRSLRAGHPVPMGIKLVAEEMPAPISGEFRLVHEGMAYGLNLRQALERMSQRLGVAEIHYMVAAIRIHSATGGNLADVLGSLANVVKQRDILRLKVTALSAQSRMSGNILSIVPFAIVFLMYRINPDYYAEIYRHPKLAAIMGAAGLVTLAGILMIRRIVNFRV